MHKLFRNRRFREFVAWSMCLTLALPSSVIAGDKSLRLISYRSGPTAMEQLAERIDRMERNLEEYGSVVIKTPDVWGESRLMRHRSEVENQLRARLDGFEFRINAVQATRDAAFLATAIALQEQIGSGVAALTTDSTSTATNSLVGNPNVVGTATNPNMVPRNQFLTEFAGTDGKANKTLNVGIEPVIELDQVNRYLQHLNELRRLNEGDDNADTPGYALNLIRIPISVLPGRKTEEGFGAEVQITIDPYISDEILPLAFKDFVINGVVDRISFDVLHIAQTSDIGELQKAILKGDSLIMPPAIANAKVMKLHTASYQAESQSGAVVNDEPVDSESKARQVYNILQSLPDAQAKAFSTEVLENPNDISSLVDTLNLALDQQSVLKSAPEAVEVSARQILSAYVLADVNQQDLSIPASHRETVDGNTLLRIGLHAYTSLVHTGVSRLSGDVPHKQIELSHRIEHGLTMPEVQSLVRREAEAAYEFLAQPTTASLWSDFCTPELARSIREHRRDLVNTDPTYTQTLSGLDEKFATRETDETGRPIVEVNPRNGVHDIRNAFNREMQRSFPQARSSITEALAWQIIVESALQNEQLVRDMKETATLKNCPCISQDWMPFFGPDPVSEARYAFKEYVKCKWPIHVFALDPVNQDQNIADSFSQRREMQMSLAVAAANRGVGGQALSRFVRRLEYDLETIELNRTAIAFSHGDNTFGWRFYPRVQSPPVPSNLRATVGDLLIGGQNRDDLVRTRKLEPGIRECTALVVMPSFVPQVTVDVRTNFFRLAKHTPLHQFMHRKPGYESSMELSREITELRRLQQQCINDAHLYRDGEVFRLCKAVERLDDRLPLQTHNVTVPWENDLGGFEVFQSGKSVLEPELHGWYGAPGIVVADEGRRRNVLADLMRYRRLASEAQLAYSLLGTPDDTKEPWKSAKATLTSATSNLNTAEAAYASVVAATTDTAIFLVGKNFSVLNCRVIAGGVDVTNMIEVINRNLMQVRIPSTVSTVTTEHEPVSQNVVVHLATPHGATSRLLVPVVKDAKADAVADAVKKAEASAKTAADSAIKVSNRHPVTLEWDITKKEVKASWSGAANAILSDATDNLALKVVDKRDVFDFDDEKTSSLAGGQLLLWITCGDVKQGVNLGLMDGNCPKYANGAIDHCLTMEDLLGIVMGRIGDRLPPKADKSAIVTVRGGMKFNNGQPVIGFDDKIIFNLIPDASQPKP